MSIKTSKPSCSIEPFTLDYAPFYDTHGLDINTDLITSSVWVVTGGTGGFESFVTPKTTIVLSDGAVGVQMVAKNVIEINGGAFKTCATLFIDVT